MLSEEERDAIRHALGLNDNRRWSYRNYYAANPGDAVMVSLHAKGFAARGRDLNTGEATLHCYYITTDGMEAAGVLNRVPKSERPKP